MNNLPHPARQNVARAARVGHPAFAPQIFVLVATTEQHYDDPEEGRRQVEPTTRVVYAGLDREKLSALASDLNGGTADMVVDYGGRAGKATAYRKREKHLLALDPLFDFGPSPGETVYSVIEPPVVGG